MIMWSKLCVKNLEACAWIGGPRRGAAGRSLLCGRPGAGIARCATSVNAARGARGGGGGGACEPSGSGR